jgi:hypothetical protein
MTRRQRLRSAERQGWEADAALLTSRLQRLGLPERHPIRLHTNRTVMVSLTSRGTVRIHRGYAYAADRTLEAVVNFLRPGVDARTRAAAKRMVLAFAVDRHLPVRRSRRGIAPEDRNLVTELERRHAELNRQYFDGQLSRIPIRVSSRMTTRLGELVVDGTTGGAAEIAVNRRHMQRDGWTEVRDTLLHEMVHQWQAERGHPADHGRSFKEKAREVGIVPAARKADGGSRTD